MAKKASAPSSAYRALAKRVNPRLERGDYKGALSLVRTHLSKDPEDFYTRYLYAKSLGDWADELPSAQKRRYKSESISILKVLMKDLRGRDLTTRWRLPLNFYYQSENWKGMYAFGQRFARVDRRLANYTKALGATYIAETSKASARKTFSLRAIRAWSAYDVSREKYYFVHYVFAKALALNGQFDEAMRRLQVAARLGKRPITDWEFADVAKLCEPKKR